MITNPAVNAIGFSPAADKPARPLARCLAVIRSLEATPDGKRRRAYGDALYPLLSELPKLGAIEATSALAEIGKIDPKRWEAPALLAGVNRYGWGSFLFYNAAGGIVWATVFGLGGYVFGEAIHRFTGPIGIIALVAVIVGIGISWWIVRRQEERMEERILTEEQEKQRFED